MGLDDESSQFLNFAAKLVSDYPEDRRRQFLVSFYLADLTLAVFETEVPNSGFKSGKFLQRTRVRDPATKLFFKPDAFYVGARLQLSGRVFELTDAAPHTLNLMEAHSDEFPDANIELVLSKLPASVAADLKAADAKGTGSIPVLEAKKIYEALIPTITPHAVLTLLRAGDQGDGIYKYGAVASHLTK